MYEGFVIDIVEQIVVQFTEIGDFCDTGMICPLAKMYTLGSGFIPSANHAGGLRFHGMSSTLSQLYHDGLMEARAVEQTSVFAAAEQFARVEGIVRVVSR